MLHTEQDQAGGQYCVPWLSPIQKQQGVVLGDSVVGTHCYKSVLNQYSSMALEDVRQGKMEMPSL